jgi:Uncharacterised nucleotidyltransferase
MSTNRFDTPEYAFLRRCCRRELTSDHELADLLFRRPIDWPLLLAAALSNEVIPSLYFQVSAFAQNLLPQPVFAQLRELWWQSAARNLVLASELLRVLEILEHHAIRAVPFKGPALAVQAYGNVLLRDSGDLDIFVDRKDVCAACLALLSSGYVASDMQELRDASVACKRKDITLVHEETNIAVEIHWTFTSPELACRFDAHQLWTRLASISLAGKAVPAFGIEDLILVLCIHGARHCWDRLKWVADLAALLSSSSFVDWVFVVRQAEQAGCRRMLFVGLLLACDLSGAPFPMESALTAREARILDRLTAQVKRLVVTRSRRNLLEVYGFQMRIRERFRDRIPVIHAFLLGRLRPVAYRARKCSFSLSLFASGVARLFHYRSNHGFSLLRLSRSPTVKGPGPAAEIHPGPGKP